ncbi:uncharacterized protein [Nicotiana tomentosiformis]|uniref:uncharacterized protein n=1 Tax=Nicotiana tomentosiformis TaxID=4098 RepID=UPI00388C475A
MKNGPFFAPPNVDYEIIRFHTLFNPTIPGQIKDLLLSENGLKLFKKICFGYLFSLPRICMQNQAIHLLMKYELNASDSDFFSAEIKDQMPNFDLREFALISGLRCFTEVTDFGYTPMYDSKIMRNYFPNKEKVEKSYLKQIVANRSWVNDEVTVKLCILYLIEFFLCPSDKDNAGLIDHFRFYLVDSVQYMNYAWGSEFYIQLLQSVRHKLNPSVHFYIIRGFALTMQIWLYECCSTVNTDIATRVDNSIPRILSWSSSKDKI